MLLPNSNFFTASQRGGFLIQDAPEVNRSAERGLGDAPRGGVGLVRGPKVLQRVTKCYSVLQSVTKCYGFPGPESNLRRQALRQKYYGGQESALEVGKSKGQCPKSGRRGSWRFAPCVKLLKFRPAAITTGP